jgi:L-ribulokinase
MIIERMEKYKVKIDTVINCGGIAEKNPLLMQIYADVLNRTMLISGSAQTCALGSAILASVLGDPDKGYHPDVETAQAKMVGFKDRRYEPQAANVGVYDSLFALYQEVHDSFGIAGQQFDHGQFMKKLLEIKNNSSK